MQTLLALAVLSIVPSSGDGDPLEAVRLVVDGTPSAVLRFRVVDEKDRPIPARLTFVGAKGAGMALFPRVDAAPKELAVRKDVVYALHGAVAITVPEGTFRVHASHGPEWSLATNDFTFVAGKTYEWTAKLVHEVDTSGWIGADFHLHTLTYSGHGDANLEERLISLIGEGVELAVATDHNHLTDYRPALETLGAANDVTAITGDEVTTSIGHFNVFPLDPTRAPIAWKSTNANELFALARAEPNALGVAPIVQVNHPRWEDGDWFGKTGLDLVSGESKAANWSGDFDTLEVMNSNALLGYADAELVEEKESTGSVLADWFHLLNRGARYGAVGNSDSHTVRFDFAGYPRTYVRSAASDVGKPEAGSPAGRIDVKEVAESLRAKRMFATSGPFVDVSAEGQGSGATVKARDGRVTLRVKTQAASWIDVDRAKVYVNGDLVRTLASKPERTVVRIDETVELPIDRDAWIVVTVEGDDSLAPVLADEGRKHLPRAVTNPIWVDGDGDGAWTSPAERVRVAAAHCDGADEASSVLRRLSPSEAAFFVLAGASAKRPWAATIVASSLESSDRSVRLAACRAAEMLGDPALAKPLATAFHRSAKDGFARLCAYSASRACGATDLVDRYGELVESLRPAQIERHRKELHALFPGTWVTEWRVRGPMLVRADAPTLPWKNASSIADGAGFVDLAALAPGKAENARFEAETYLTTTEARRIGFALGTDDGCRLVVDGQSLVEDAEPHDAALRSFGTLDLTPGKHLVQLEVSNGRGASGFRFGILDASATVAWSRE